MWHFPHPHIQEYPEYVNQPYNDGFLLLYSDASEFSLQHCWECSRECVCMHAADCCKCARINLLSFIHPSVQRLLVPTALDCLLLALTCHVCAAINKSNVAVVPGTSPAQVCGRPDMHVCAAASSVLERVCVGGVGVARVLVGSGPARVQAVHSVRGGNLLQFAQGRQPLQCWHGQHCLKHKMGREHGQGAFRHGAE